MVEYKITFICDNETYHLSPISIIPSDNKSLRLFINKMIDDKLKEKGIKDYSVSGIQVSYSDDDWRTWHPKDF